MTENDFLAVVILTLVAGAILIASLGAIGLFIAIGTFGLVGITLSFYCAYEHGQFLIRSEQWRRESEQWKRDQERNKP